MIERLLRLAARTSLLLLCFLSGAYALLAYIPFTYEAVIKFPMVSWIPTFVRFHPGLFLALVLANLAVDHAHWRGPQASWAWQLFGGIAGLLAVLLLFHPALQGIRNEASSLLWAVAFLLLPLWLLLLDARYRLARCDLANGT